MARPSTPRGLPAQRVSASSRRSSRFARISPRRISAAGIRSGSGGLSADATAPRRAHARRALVVAEPSCPTRRLSSSLRIGSAPAASWRSRSYARRHVTTCSHTPPSSKPRERRARRRLGSNRRVPIRLILISVAPPRAALDRGAAKSGRTRADKSGSRSCDALDRLFPALEPRALVAAGLIVNSSADAPGDHGRNRGSPLATGASTAGERRSDIVKCSHEANLLLARESFHRRPCARFREASTAPFDDPRRGVGSQLIAGCAEHLQCLLQGGEGVGRCGVASRPSSGRVEAPRRLDQLRRAVGQKI